MIQESKILRVFFLEDNPDDVELELHELLKAGFKVSYEVARNRKIFFEKLPRFIPDVILADYELPDITGIEAIDLCKKMEIEAPVILMTGEGNEQAAVDSLRLGAIDYIIKKNISGLPARVSRALEIWNDRKAKEHVEAEKQRLQQLLFEAQKMEAIGRAAGGIAHDFNNILTGIMGFAEICLNDAKKDSRIYDYLQSILSLSERGSDLIKQLLIFGKRTPMELKTVDLNSYMGETAQFLKRLVGETVEIRLDLPEDTPQVKFDTGQFMRVLMNLVLNARDAMNGIGVVRIKTEKCRLPEELAPGGPEAYTEEYVSISVSDTGIGIQEENIHKIFEPFYTTKAMGKGTGLGLSIVYSVVSAHGGWIKVFSGKGAGTTFSIYLPMLPGDPRGDI